MNANGQSLGTPLWWKMAPLKGPLRGLWNVQNRNFYCREKNRKNRRKVENLGGAEKFAQFPRFQSRSVFWTLGRRSSFNHWSPFPLLAHRCAPLHFRNALQPAHWVHCWSHSNSQRSSSVPMSWCSLLAAAAPDQRIWEDLSVSYRWNPCDRDFPSGNIKNFLDGGNSALVIGF